MHDKLQSLLIKTMARYRLLVVAFAVVLLGTVSIVVIQMESFTPSSVGDIPNPNITSEIDIHVLPAALPERIIIPKLGIDAPFESPLGIDAQKEIEVPEAYDTVGYYKYGPTPGELGPAVVLGHVDSVAGPAVFYNLGQLEVGDEIEISRQDGTVATFVVDTMERHLQSGFPTEQVYGNINHAGLRLITCSGIFDRGVQRYSHNLIVFARLQEGD